MHHHNPLPTLFAVVHNGPVKTLALEVFGYCAAALCGCVETNAENTAAEAHKYSDPLEESPQGALTFDSGHTFEGALLTLGNHRLL